MRRRVGVWLVTIALSVPAAAFGQSRGVQFTPDGKRVLVNKDVGSERWAITLEQDGSATGNVFRSDGPPAFIACEPTGTPFTFDCSGADACTDPTGAMHGTQRTPRGTPVLVQKDVGAERWAISLNDDGTVTGNVYFADDRAPAFIVCTATSIQDRFACAGADACPAAPCERQFRSLGEVTVPPLFFAVPQDCPETYASLGTVTVPEDFFSPAASVVPVTFTLTTDRLLQGVDVRVAYPSANGNFRAARNTTDAACTSDDAVVLVTGDMGIGNLVVIVVDAVALTFPITVQCEFTATSPITLDDLEVTVREVVVDGRPGDIDAVTVDVAL
jgi:hypothetical protein